MATRSIEWWLWASGAAQMALVGSAAMVQTIEDRGFYEPLSREHQHRREVSYVITIN